MTENKRIHRIILSVSLIGGSAVTLFIGLLLVLAAPTENPIDWGSRAMEYWDDEIVKRVPNKKRPEWCIYRSAPVDDGYFEVECYQKLASQGDEATYLRTFCNNDEYIFSCSQKDKTPFTFTTSEAGKMRRYYGDEEPTKEEQWNTTVSQMPGIILMLISLITAFIVVPSLLAYWLILFLVKKQKAK